MRVPLAWLGDLVSLPADPAELAERLTAAGVECEVGEAATFPERVVTGKIVECAPHPRADRLRVCRVDVGEDAPREIVCGAPNARAGRVGAVALPGAVLAGGVVVSERTVRGVRSRGMLCSERELGISQDHSGILLLPGEAPPGRPLGEVLGAGGVLETYPASNRGDLMSVVGLAREVAALSGRRWEPPEPRPPRTSDSGGWSVRIEDPADCPRYGGRVVEGLLPGPSPPWLAERLAAAGVRPLLNLVDATNYVLLELGHPLHAFDVERLAGREIGVRRSREGERLRTLDGKERRLAAGTLLITDGSGPIALGGILGGQATAVSEATRCVFLEGASFDPARIRAGRRALGLVTDASARFERGVDPEGVRRALDRCVELLLQLCPGARLVASVDSYPAPVERRRVRLRRRTLRRLLGVEIEPEEVARFLEALGLAILRADGRGWEVEVPTFRRDLSAEEDLVEEVARLHGYDRFPESSRAHALGGRLCEPRIEKLWKGRSVLLSLGLTEVVTPSLVDGSREGALVEGEAFFRCPVPLRNPLTSDRDALRGSLLPSLLQVLATNRARAGTGDLAIFEVGRAFARSGAAVEEGLRAGILLAGLGLEAQRGMGSNSCDFFDMKGLLEVYVEEFWGEPLRLEAGAPAPLGGERCAALFAGGKRIGFLGEPDRRVRKAFDLPPDLPVVLAELDLEVESGSEGEPFFEPLPRYPGVVRDLAFVVDKRRRHEELAAALRAAGGELLREVRLFDVYEGPPLAPTEKNLAYTIVFRAADRSLTHEEVDGIVGRVVRHVEERLGARIR